jgi:hypothetical protein
MSLVTTELLAKRVEWNVSKARSADALYADPVRGRSVPCMWFTQVE